MDGGAGGRGQGLADGVGLSGLVRHEKTVLDAIKVGFEFRRAIVWGAEQFVVLQVAENALKNLMVNAVESPLCT